MRRLFLLCTQGKQSPVRTTVAAERVFNFFTVDTQRHIKYKKCHKCKKYCPYIAIIVSAWIWMYLKTEFGWMFSEVFQKARTILPNKIFYIPILSQIIKHNTDQNTNRPSLQETIKQLPHYFSFPIIQDSLMNFFSILNSRIKHTILNQMLHVSSPYLCTSFDCHFF